MPGRGSLLRAILLPSLLVLSCFFCSTPKKFTFLCITCSWKTHSWLPFDSELSIFFWGGVFFSFSCALSTLTTQTRVHVYSLYCKFRQHRVGLACFLIFHRFLLQILVGPKGQKKKKQKLVP